RIRSTRTAAGYLGDHAPALVDADGFVDTGDVVERRGDRYHFVGRRGGIINVGGLKVHPEEVEAVINAHPHVRMSRVRTRKNPITGALVVADLVLNGGGESADGRVADVQREILRSEEHTSELQSRRDLVCRLLLEKKKIKTKVNGLLSFI